MQKVECSKGSWEGAMRTYHVGILESRRNKFLHFGHCPVGVSRFWSYCRGTRVGALLVSSDLHFTPMDHIRDEAVRG